jgi:hypothetical protein
MAEEEASMIGEAAAREGLAVDEAPANEEWGA